MTTENPRLSVRASDFRAALTAALLVVCKDDMLPAINAVQIDFQADQVSLRSTDRFQLVIAEVPYIEKSERPLDGGHTFLMSSKDAATLLKSIPTNTRDGNQIDFWNTTDELTVLINYGLSLSLQEYPGNFPRVAGLLPKEDSLPDTAQPVQQINPAFLSVVSKLPRETKLAQMIEFHDKKWLVPFSKGTMTGRYLVMTQRVATS